MTGREHTFARGPQAVFGTQFLLDLVGIGPQPRARVATPNFIAAAEQATGFHQTPEGKVWKETDLTQIAERIIFDWDGVLCDSTKRLNRATYYLIKEKGEGPLAAALTEQEVTDTFDMPVWDYLRKYGVKVDDEDPEKQAELRAKISDEYHNEYLLRKYDDMPDEDDMFPEAIETIKMLHEQGIKLDIISAGDENKIRAVLARHGLSHCFESVLGGQRDKTQAIANAAAAAEKNGTEPSKILYFGDLPSDIRHTKNSNSGVRSVAVAFTPAAQARLEGTDTDFMVTGMKMDDLKKARGYVQST
jgi:phosphoglycolate phosphatase-like HAD superfamily hydrolase